MSAGSLNQLFPSSGAGMGAAMANPQNISALQQWPQTPSPFTPQQTSSIDQLGNIFQQFVNPTTLGNLGGQPITNPLDQAIAAMGLIPMGR